MIDALLHVFDAWEPLVKARKAKGLDQWARLAPIADKLAGKGVQAISFTCAHPSHAGEPVKHHLGSAEGNLHFMLGYGNPAFHLAPYHWMIIDPNTTEEEAEETFARMHHPSNPVLWSKTGFSVGDEGDIAEGKPHPNSAKAKVQKQAEDARAAEGIKAKSPTGTYTCVPSEGLVYGDHNGHVYRWDMVKDTFFSEYNPEATEAMESAAVTKSQRGIRFRTTYPDAVRVYAATHRGEEFANEVFPLVKSRMPKPGAIVSLESDKAESVFGVVTPTSLDFYNRDGSLAEIRVFDRVYKSFDLVKDGNVPPAALLSLIVSVFGVNQSLLTDVTKSAKTLVPAVTAVDGEPSPGYGDVPSEFVEGFSKSIKCLPDGELLLVMEPA